jgi:tRNA-dihydrouridine synthase
MDNTQEQLIFELESEYEKRKLAEESLKKCEEICKSYFTYGLKSESNNTRYGAIVKIVSEYFEQIKKEDNNEDRGIQSEHC